MGALFFLLLGGLALLVAAGRIWMNASSGTLNQTRTAGVDNPGVADPRHRG